MGRKKRKKNNKKFLKLISFVLLASSTILFLISYNKYQKREEEKRLKLEKEELAKKIQNHDSFCSLEEFSLKKENEKILEKKKYEEVLAKILEEKKKKAALSKNKTIIISTNSRGKSSLGNFYAFGDGTMFRKGKISTGRKNYETPRGIFNLKYKKKESMSNVYPDPSGRNNMNNMLAITNSGIALHEGSPEQSSHGCVHIAPSDSEWLYNWVDENTKIYITNKANIKYKYKTLNELIEEINNFNQEEKERLSVKTEIIEKWPNGKIRAKKTYRGGRLEGQQYFYYSTGQLKAIYTYYHDRKNAIQKEYYKNGQKKSWIYLVGGKAWEKMTWYPSGEMISYYKKELKK